MWQLPLSGGENLATNVFKNNRPRLEVHHQHGLELGLCPLQLHLVKGKKNNLSAVIIAKVTCVELPS